MHNSKKTVRLTKSIKWKVVILFITYSFMSMNSAKAQFTAIPDPAFEAALVSLGIDNINGDHQVLTTAISKITNLNVSKKYITDLTGIKSFTSLTVLECYQNELTSLDLSGMTSLSSLSCAENQLTNLNLNGLTSLNWVACGWNKLQSLNLNGLLNLEVLGCSNNQLLNLDLSGLKKLQSFSCSYNQLASLNPSGLTALRTLHCNDNQITTLNVSDLTSLNTLFCNNNNLVSLDVSKNVKLNALLCDSNNLTNLNIKNGTNTAMSTFYMNFKNNPSLTCIQVDNKSFADLHWSTYKDASVNYSNDCIALDINKTDFGRMSIYPNPSKGKVHIDNIILKKVTVYDTSGKLIHSTGFNSNSETNTLNLGSMTRGKYYIFIEAEKGSIAKQIMIDY